MKRSVIAFLVTILVFSMLPGFARADNITTKKGPSFYRIVEDKLEAIDHDTFEEALADSVGYTLFISGGKVTLRKSLNRPVSNIALHNASLVLESGRYQMDNLPLLIGNSSFTVQSGSELTIRQYSPRTRFIGRGGNAFIALSSGAKYTMEPMGKDKNAPSITSQKDVMKKLKSLKEQSVHITLDGTVTANAPGAALTDDSLTIKKGGTLIIAKRCVLNLMGISLENYGKLVVDGSLSLGKKTDGELDMLYMLEEVRSLNELAIGRGPASKIINYGEIQSKGHMVLFRGAVLENKGVAKIGEVLNAGDIHNAGEIDILVSGNPIIAANNTKELLATFNMGDMDNFPLFYSITVKRGETLKEIQAPKISGIHIQAENWFIDKKLTSFWDMENDKILENIKLYAGL